MKWKCDWECSEWGSLELSHYLLLERKSTLFTIALSFPLFLSFLLLFSLHATKKCPRKNCSCIFGWATFLSAGDTWRIADALWAKRVSHPKKKIFCFSKKKNVDTKSVDKTTLSNSLTYVIWLSKRTQMSTVNRLRRFKQNSNWETMGKYASLSIVNLLSIDLLALYFYK